MKISAHDLPSILNKQFYTLYCLIGDEIVLMDEANALIRQKAKEHGFEETIQYIADRQFDWSSLYTLCQTHSLFHQKQCISIRLTAPQLSEEAKTILEEITDVPSKDWILILQLPKSASQGTQARFLKIIEKNGLLVQIWSLGKQFLPWIKEKARERGIQIQNNAWPLLVEQCQNNPFAAKQTLEKLALRYPEAIISLDHLKIWMDNESLFDPYKWVDSLLEGNIKKSTQIAERLQTQKEAPILMLFALVKELRLLIQIHYCLKENKKSLKAFLDEKKIWSSRHALIEKAVKLYSETFCLNQLLQAYQLDQWIKTEKKDRIWLAFFEIIRLFSLESEKNA